MNRKHYSLAFGSIIAVLVLTSCGRTEVPVATDTPLPVLPSAAQEQSEQATSTPPQVETRTAPTDRFAQMSQKWRVAYFESDSMQICVIDGDGSDRSCLDVKEEMSAAGYATPGFLALSPDGAKVAYGTECSIYIWSISRDVVPLRKDEPCGSFREVTWSPDGNSIAYISEELYRSCSSCQSFFGDIFISRLDGTVHRALTEELDGWSHWPDWSPDGKNIVFSLGQVGQVTQSGYTVNEDIMVMSAEGGSAVKLTYHPAPDSRPVWSPDGIQIAFLSTRNQEELINLYLMNASGGDLRMVVELGSPLDWPYRGAYFFWLPDGIHMIHDYGVINTFTRQIETMDLPFGLSYGSWAMPGEHVVVSPAPALTPALSTSETADCAADWSQLSPDIYAVVAGEANDLPNRVREAPNTGAEIIYQIYPGTIVRVLEGPVCTNGLVFWKVENENIPGGNGWTAEGDLKDYFLEPVQ